MTNDSKNLALMASVLLTLCSQANSIAQESTDTFPKIEIMPLKIHGIDTQGSRRHPYNFVEEEKNRHILARPNGYKTNEYGGYVTNERKPNDYPGIKPGVGALKIYGITVEPKIKPHSFHIKALPKNYPSYSAGDFGIDERLRSFYSRLQSNEPSDN